MSDKTPGQTGISGRFRRSRKPPVLPSHGRGHWSDRSSAHSESPPFIGLFGMINGSQLQLTVDVDVLVSFRVPRRVSLESLIQNPKVRDLRDQEQIPERD